MFLMKLFKKLIKVYVILWAFLLSPVSLHGYFYNLQEWSNGAQTLFLFSDKHVETKEPFPQRIDLINAAKRMNAFVVAEDKLDVAIIGLDSIAWSKVKLPGGLKNVLEASSLWPLYRRIYCDCYEEIIRGVLKAKLSYNPNVDYSHLLPSDYLTVANQHFSPLVGLTQFCRQHGIFTKNIEFRFYEVLEDVLDLHRNAIAELSHYDDSPILKTFYDGILFNEFNAKITRVLRTFVSSNTYTNVEKFIDNDLLYDKVFDDLFEEISDTYLGAYSRSSENRKSLELKPFSTKKRLIIRAYDSPLIAARILHEIYCNSSCPFIFVCAGGGHMVDVSSILSKIGFELIRNIGTSWDAESEQHIFAVDIKNYFECFHAPYGAIKQ
jgi:hypothetical protein